MPPPEHYRSMSDEQLAEWHQLVSQLDALREQLAAEQLTTANLKEQLGKMTVEYGQVHADYSSELEKVLAERNEAQHDATRARNQVKVLARHVPDFLGDWLSTYEHFADHALSVSALTMRQNARELLVLLGQLDQ